MGKTHGCSRTRLYRIYMGIKGRCNRPSCVTYKKYGAKGIKLCDEWSGSDGVSAFIKWALENGYKNNLTIDRIDPAKGYSPDNCRWATYTEQNSHLRQPVGKSGVRGVSWSEKDQKWVSIISVNNKSVRIGCFNSIMDAALARNEFIKDRGLLREPTKIDKFYFDKQEERFAAYTAQTSLFDN